MLEAVTHATHILVDGWGLLLTVGHEGYDYENDTPMTKSVAGYVLGWVTSPTQFVFVTAVTTHGVL
jgi:hypothetical protein